MAEGHGFGHGRVAPRHQDLVDGLDLLARTNRPKVGHGCANGLQQGPGALHQRPIATHQNRQGSSLGPFGAAGDGGIKATDPSGLEPAMEPLGLGGLNRGEIDHKRAWPQAGRGALIAKQDGFCGGPIGDAKTKDGGVGGRLGGTSGPGGTGRGKGFFCAPAAVMDRQGVAARQQVGRHRRPELAQTNEANRGQRVASHGQRCVKGGLGKGATKGHRSQGVGPL